MFALLEHDAGPDRHWDLLLEVPGHERLPTWRLARDPLQAADDVPAERIGDHRPLYLDFEGALSDHRGMVRRLDRGPAAVEAFGGDEASFTLEGALLRGRFTIAQSPAGLVFRRACSVAPPWAT